MSYPCHGAMNWSTVLRQNDERAMIRHGRMAVDSPFRPFEPGVLWSGPLLLGSDITAERISAEADPGEVDDLAATGCASWLKITGVTRDSAGAALGSCIVQGFLTSSDLFLRQLTSDAGGYFEFPTEYPATAHYLVAYKAGSPDVTGASVNTLTPS